MPSAIVSKIGSGSRVIRMVSLGAIAGIDGRRSSRVGVRIISISGVVTAVISAISQTEHRACDQPPYDTRSVVVVAIAAISTIAAAVAAITTSAESAALKSTASKASAGEVCAASAKTTCG